MDIKVFNKEEESKHSKNSMMSQIMNVDTMVQESSTKQERGNSEMKMTTMTKMMITGLSKGRSKNMDIGTMETTKKTGEMTIIKLPTKTPRTITTHTKTITTTIRIKDMETIIAKIMTMVTKKIYSLINGVALILCPMSQTS